MLHRLAILVVAVTLGVTATGMHVRAALDETAPDKTSGLELLVLEVKNCFVCGYVRSHIQPAYERSTTAHEAPMRFIDLNEIDESSFGLAMPVTTVPTIVLMRDGHEVARLAGYTGPQIFFQALPNMMARAQDAAH